MYRAIRGGKVYKHKRFICRHCYAEFENRGELYVHQRLDHAMYMRGGDVTASGDASQELDQYDEIPPLKAEPWDSDSNPFDQNDNPSALLWQAEYNLHRHEILEGDLDYDMYATYNFPLPGFVDDNMIKEQLNYIYDQEQTAFKIYVSPGYILEKRSDKELELLLETGELNSTAGLSNVRYFAPHGNNYVNDGVALTVTNKRELDEVIEYFQSIDINAFADRPNTAYKVAFWTNLKWFIYRLPKPLGRGGIHDFLIT